MLPWTHRANPESSVLRSRKSQTQHRSTPVVLGFVHVLQSIAGEDTPDLITAIDALANPLTPAGLVPILGRCSKGTGAFNTLNALQCGVSYRFLAVSPSF